jgi:AcrR family transcriptional regulator
MTTIDRHEQRRLRTQQRLLDAAEQVFGQKGYQDASVLDITEAADVSKRTFYLHFPDKEALIEELAMRSFEDLRVLVEAQDKALIAFNGENETPDMTMRENYHVAARIIFEYAQSKPDLMQIIFGRGGSFRLQAMSREFTARAFAENFAHDHCVWRSDAPVPPVVLANAVAGIIHQLLCWWFQYPNDYSADDMALMCTSVLYDSIEINFDKHPTEESKA